MSPTANPASRLAALGLGLAGCGLAGAATPPPASEAHAAATTILWCAVGPDLRAADCQLPSPQIVPNPDHDEALREIAAHPLRLEGLRAGDHTEVVVRLRYDWPLRDALDPGRPSRLFTVQQRTWLAAPPADITTRYYPERAQRMGQNGEVYIQCRIDSTGLLNPCWVIANNADPSLGFGAAALQISKLYRMAPTTTDGLATAGGQYRLRFTFVLPR